jgi:hypothetical protein
MTDRELMQQALGALERSVSTCFDRRAHEEVMSRPEHFINQTITALRTAIAEAESVKPIAWANINKHGDITHTNNKRMPWSKTPLYTIPPAAQPAKQKPVAWLGLEPSDMPDGDDPMYDHDFFLKGMVWADAILRKKNATPPEAQRQWVGLTESDRRLIGYQWQDGNGTATEIIDLVEAKLKEKNHE